MLNFITGSIAKIFGSKSDRDVKLLLPIVDKINAEFAKLQSIDDDALRGKTFEVKAIINDKLKAIDTRLAELKANLEDNTIEVGAKEAIFTETDKL